MADISKLQVPVSGTQTTFDIKDAAARSGLANKVNNDGGTISGTLVLSKRGDASGTADNSPALIVGGTVSQTHIEMDENEIIAKSDATHGADLYLNYDGGGSVHIGPNATITVGENTTRAKGNLNLYNNFTTGYLYSDGTVITRINDFPVATGSPSFALGHHTSASGYSSLAHGSYCVASGEKSHAEGLDCSAEGDKSHAEGHNCDALGNMSHAEGSSCETRGHGSHAEGCYSFTSGNACYSHAEGHRTETLEKGAHAEGNHTLAVDHYCHAEGVWTIARSKPGNSIGSHAAGYKTVAAGYGSYAHGYLKSDGTLGTYYDDKTLRSTAYPPIYSEGDGSTASGFGAKGAQIHAKGDGSFANGYVNGNTEAYDGRTLDTPNGIRATGKGSHAEGYTCLTYNMDPEAAEYNWDELPWDFTEASGDGSHAEGINTHAFGDASHTSGYRTEAHGRSTFVIGEYNRSGSEDQPVKNNNESQRGTYAFVIGNGLGYDGSEIDARSDALTVDWNGNVRASGAVYANGVDLKNYIDTQIATAITQVLATAY